MKSLMEVLGANPTGSSNTGSAGASDRRDPDALADGDAEDTSPDQNEAIKSLATDCFSALKEGDREGFADNLIAMIEMVR